MKTTKKETERYYLETFRKICSDFPAGDIKECEEPDFIIGGSDNTVGIEVTELYHQHKRSRRLPMQAIEHVTDSIVEEASLIHGAAGGPALTVRVDFKLGSRKFGRRQRSVIASKLAALVLQTPIEMDGCAELENDYESLTTFPEEITRIRIQRNRFRSRALWNVPRAAFIPRLKNNDLQSRIDEKNRRASVYRRRTPEVWLLIAHSLHFSLASTFENSKETLQHKYESNFDRTFLLDVFGRQCNELIRDR